MIINKEKIKQLLPHREPFLFLDKCEIIEIGIKGRDIKGIEKGKLLKEEQLQKQLNQGNLL